MIYTKEIKMANLLENLSMIKWQSIILVIVAFFLNRIILFDAFYTLGTCYVGALCFNRNLRKWTPFIGALGMLSLGRFDLYILKYLLIIGFMFLLRAYFHLSGSAFNLRNQALSTGISVFCINSLLVMLNRFKVLELLVGLLETVIAMGLVVIFYYATETMLQNRSTALSQKESISIAFLIACIFGGFIDFYVQVPLFRSIYLKDVMIFIIIIAVTYLGGIHTGVIMTVVMSTLLVIIGYMPSHFVAIYTLAVLIGSLFLVIDRLGVIFATGMGLLLGFAVFNERIIDMQVLGAYLIASLITFILPKSYFGIATWFANADGEEDEKHLIRVQKIMTEKLNQFSKAFYHLSHTFEKISDQKVLLDDKDINHIIEDTGEKMCQHCSMNTFCWKDYIKETYQSAYKMMDIIEKKGQLKLGDIPETFKNSCIHAESFACTLGFRLDLFKQNLVWKNRFAQSRSLLAQQFEAIAQSIAKLCINIEKEFYFNKEDAQLIKETIHKKGIKTKDIMVIENHTRKEEIHLYTAYYKNDLEIKDQVIKAIYEALDISVETERIECNEKERYLYFKFKVTKSYSILAGAAFHAKSEISGDVYSYMEVDEGKYLLALADGMGSGQLAMEESTATIELLESFIDSGFQNDLAVKMINSVLVLKSDIENFSTMDITLIDEYTGIAEFLKLGAATSFILRDQEVMTIQANTLPVGILHDVDIEVCKKQLKDGDVIIMVTDGMLQGQNELLGKEETFKHFILEANTNNPSYMAEYLMQKSRDLLGTAENDDMTIIVARIWKRK